jgi:hypothetical protein
MGPRQEPATAEPRPQRRGEQQQTLSAAVELRLALPCSFVDFERGVATWMVVREGMAQTGRQAEGVARLWNDTEKSRVLCVGCRFLATRHKRDADCLRADREPLRGPGARGTGVFGVGLPKTRDWGKGALRASIWRPGRWPPGPGR